MHEMSLAEGILQIVEDAATAQHFVAVKRVRLEIGQLAAVERPSLRFAFDAIKLGTVAEAAALEIIDLPGSAWCMVCCAPVAIAARGEPCPQCGSHQLQVTGGDEMRVKDLELAD